MGMFSNNSQHNTTETSEEVTAPVFEGYSAEVNGDILALEESYDDRQAIIEAIHAMDSAELRFAAKAKQLRESAEEAGEEVDEDALNEAEAEFEATTEATVKDAWAAIVKLFTNLWGKLKEFFSSVVRQFDSLILSGEAFAKKYEKRAAGLNTSGFAYAAHKYTHLDDFQADVDVKGQVATYKSEVMAAITGGKDIEAIKATTEEMRNYQQDELGKLRGTMIGKSDLSNEEYKRELRAYFRGGETGPAKEGSFNVSEAFAALKNTKAREVTKKTAAAVDKEFGALVSALKKPKLEKGDDKKLGDAQLNLSRAFASTFSAQKSITLQAFRAWKDAWAERERVYKSGIVAAFTFGSHGKKPAAEPEAK